MSKLTDYELTIIRFTTAILAYVMNADGDAMKPEERARLMTFLGKYVSHGQMSHSQVQKTVADAQKIIGTTPFADFIASRTIKELYPGQRLAVYINAVDACLVDDVLAGGQTSELEALRRALDIDLDTAKAIKQVFMVKNSGAVLGDILHPTNAAKAPMRLHMTKVE